MEDLQIAWGARQDADDMTGEAARRRRRSPAAARDTRRSGRQSEDRAQTGRSERNPAASGQRKRHRPRKYQVPREYQAPSESADPIIVTLLAGLVAEAALPWSVIWFSDLLLFDVPAWSLWLIFGVPPALTFLAVLVQWAMHRRKQWRWQHRGPEVHTPRPA